MMQLLIAKLRHRATHMENDVAGGELVLTLCRLQDTIFL